MFATVAHSLPSSAQGWLDAWVTISAKATVLLAVAGLLALALRHRSAAARHLSWSAALAGLLLLPPLELWGPRVGVKGVPRLAIGTADAARVPIAEGEHWTATTPKTPEPTLETPAPSRDERVPMKVETAAAPVAKDHAPIDWRLGVLTTWAVGAFLVLTWLALGAWMLRRFDRAARPVTDRDWLALFEDSARVLGLDRPVELLTSADVSVPCTWGLVQPRVLMPAAARDWPQERRRVVLLHELAHVVRRDCLVQTLAQVACALFWFHPLVWVAARRLWIERERACDDLVLAADTAATDYADHLLAVVRAMRETPRAVAGAIAFARKSQFESRLIAVLDPDQRRGAVTRGRAWAAALSAALAVVPLAALRPWSASAGTTNWSAQAPAGNAAPSELLRSPTTGGMSARVGWATTEGARRGSGYWIAYEIPARARRGSRLSDTGSLDLRTLDSSWKGPRMADVLAGKSTHDPSVTPSPEKTVLAFHYAAKATGPEGVDRIRVQSDDLPADFGGQPLFWLGEPDPQQSFDWVRSVQGKVRTEEVSATALEAAAEHPDERAVRDLLTGVLESPGKARVRASAAEALGRFQDPATVEVLASTGRKDPSEDVRTSAIEGLGRMRTDESVRALSAMARDRNLPEDTRHAAIDALGEQAGDQAEQELDALVDGVVVSHTAKHKSMKKSTTSGDLPQTKIVARPDGQDVEVLDEHGNPEVTIQQRKDGKQSLKVEAKKQSAESVEEEIQRQAVQSLGRLPEEKSLPKLVNIVRTHPNESVRREALSSIGALGSPKALATLDEFAWQSTDETIARDAVDAMGQIEGSAPKVMELARRHKLARVRQQAAQSLAQRQSDPKALETLDAMVRDDPDAAVQREAVDAIGEFPENVSLPRLEKIARTHPSADVRRAAIDALGNHDPDRVAPILESLIDPAKKQKP